VPPWQKTKSHYMHACCKTSNFITVIGNSLLKNAVFCFDHKRELKCFIVKSPEVVLLIDKYFL